MKSQTLGKDISDVEVLNIDSHGFWIFIRGKEYFLPYGEYPWFKEARVSEIINVELLHDFHLRWPALDIDISLSSLEDLDRTPLKYQP